MSPERKTKIKEILEKKLNRSAKRGELINAETDQLVLLELVLDELEELKNAKIKL